MGLDFDVLEFCRELRTTKLPPYTCPVVECNKSYKSMCGLQYHLVNFDHNSKPISTTESLKKATITTPMLTASAKKIKKKGRAGKTSSIHQVSKGASPPREREPLSYTEAQKVVEFEVDDKVYRIKVDDSIPMVSKHNYELLHSKGTSGGNRNNTVDSKTKDFLAKLPEAKFNVLNDYDIPNAPPKPNNYIRFIEKSPEDMDGEVEYDMDEEDAAWLDLINEKRQEENHGEISIETFELLMDRLEKESYFQMQTNSKGQTVIDDDAVCCICMDGECQNSNVILFCDMCNLAVHQDCYGVPYIPEGQWLCRRCLQSPSRAVDCVLCPNNGGAFKQTDRGHWAHVVCALWIPEVRFANTVFLEPIDSIETIPPARWKLTCYLCKQRGVGACIQCHKTNCYSAFHVTCAQHAGLYMKMDTVKDNPGEGDTAPVLVQKIAFCNTHTPADAEHRPKILKASQLPSKGVTKTSTAPIISIPTIPPDRVQEIGSLVTIAKKNQFITRLIAYWTLKRQLRNGVPLLRRLQTTHMSRKDETHHAGQGVDIVELRNQLKYWQCLRQDLERARLLCELVRKREKLKKELVKVKAICMEMELCPLVSYLRRLLDLIRARDTGEIFIEPVDQSEVPDYSDVVKHPMDLSTMRQKIDTFQYNSLADFKADFNLMINNCLAYNAKDTVFYRAALKMREQGGALIKQAYKDMLEMGLETGESEAPPPQKSEELSMTEIDSQLEKLNQQFESGSAPEKELLTNLNKLLEQIEGVKKGVARAKRFKVIKVFIAKVKRKMSYKENMAKPAEKPVKDVYDLDTSEDEERPQKMERRKRKKDDGGPSEEKKIRKSGFETETKSSDFQLFNNVETTPTKDNDSKPKGLISSPSGVNRRTAVLFTRKAAAALKNPATPSSSPTLSSGVVKKRGRPAKSSYSSKLSLPNSDSFSTYRNGESNVKSEDESGSDDDSSCSGCDSDTGSTCSHSSEWSCSEDGTQSAVGEALEQLQLVWAKCRGYPWYPALIINPKMPRGYVHNGVPIPSPPADVIALANNYTEPVYLVLFFDTKRTWQWLPRNKLEPLGVTQELDDIKLIESRKPADRKAVKKAYQEAMAHRTQTNDKEK